MYYTKNKRIVKSQLTNDKKEKRLACGATLHSLSLAGTRQAGSVGVSIAVGFDGKEISKNCSDAGLDEGEVCYGLATNLCNNMHVPLCADIRYPDTSRTEGVNWQLTQTWNFQTFKTNKTPYNI
ncbi:hypothetical protein M0802_014629 [Mischocyttarus mexicanus]|nr:hypothetical protein M0802_014629 [Mischocyttarus mexicanus]